MGKNQEKGRNPEAEVIRLSKENDELKEELEGLKKSNNNSAQNQNNELLKFFNLPLHLLLIASIDGRILRINPGWHESLGYSSDEVLNKNLLEFVHPDDIEQTKAEMGKLQEGQTTFYFENRYKTKSGNYRWLVWSSIFISDENLYYAIAHDITRRKEAEQKLGSRERILSTIIENPVNYIIYQLYREKPGQLTRILNVSPSAKQILGLEQDEITDYGKWLSLVHPDDYNLLKENDELASKPPFKFDLKFRFLHRIKGIRWLHVKSQGIPFDSQPDTIEFVNGIIFDVTEEVEKQKALKETQLILDSFSNEAPGVFYQFMIDSKGNRSFPYISRNVSTIFEFEQHEILADANKYQNSIMKEDRRSFEEALAKSYKSLTRYYSEHRIKTASGTVKWLSTSAIPEKLEDGSVLWTGIGMDVTDKKATEEALRESEATLMAIFNHAPVLMMLLDENTNIVALNETGLKYTGKLKDEVLGKRGGDLVNCIGTINNPNGCGDGKLCEDCDVRNTVKKTLIYGLPQNKIEAEINSFDQDGNTCTITLLVSTDIVYKNNKRHVLVTLDDITDRKYAENQLKLYQGHLQDLVEERTEQLNKTNRMLKEEIAKQKESEERVKEALVVEKELNRLKTEFVSMVSHEFRTPLTSVLASADLLEIMENHNDAPAIMKHINKIQTAVETMTHMLNDVLAISRAERGRLAFNPAKTNVFDLLNEIIEEEKSRLRSNHVIEVENNLNTLEQDIDPNLLRQIFSNLISNAIKFSKPEKLIKIMLTQVREALEISIRDEGVGIPEEELEKVMEPFIRGSNSQNIQGNGLGMTIITNAVAAHHGTFKASSQSGEGTTIQIRLPLNKGR